MKVPVIYETEDHITPQAVEQSTANVVPAGSVLVVTRSGILRHTLPIAETATEVAINQDLKALTPRSGLSPAYIALALQWQSQRILKECAKSGTTVQSVETSRLLDFQIPIAPTGEQERIVHAIDEQLLRLDAGSAALRSAAANLKRLRAAILNTLLVDNTGRRWPEQRLGSVLAWGRYGTSTKCDYAAPGLPVLRIPNIQAGQVSLKDLKRAVDRNVDLAGSIVEEGDVLIIRTNGSRSLIGRAAVVPRQTEPLAFASYLIQLRFDKSRMDPHYVTAVLSAPSIRQRLESLAATSAGQYNISLEKLRSLEIPVPPLADQVSQATLTQSRLSMIGNFEGATLRERRLRSAILGAAFAGKLVRQDFSDEPASRLVERTAAQRGLCHDGHAGSARLRRVDLGEIS